MTDGPRVCLSKQGAFTQVVTRASVGFREGMGGEERRVCVWGFPFVLGFVLLFLLVIFF